MRTSVAFALSLLAVITLAACGSNSPGPSSAPSVEPSVAASEPSGTPSPGPASAAPEHPAAIVDPIVADAAALAGVDEAAVTILSYEEVTWPDGSLGCPQPDMGYIQVLIDGYKVVVLAGGVEYDYRGSGIGEFVLCPAAQPAPGATVPGSY